MSKSTKKRKTTTLREPQDKRAKASMDHIAVELRPMARAIGELREDVRNARVHPERNAEAIAASLRQFGQRKPIVVDGDGVVIAGNGLLAAARTLEWTHLACVSAADLTSEQRLAYAIADNRTGDLSAFDPALLAESLDLLEAAEYDLTELGYTEEELLALADSLEADADDALQGRPTPTTAGAAEAAERARHQRVVDVIAGAVRFTVPRAEFETWLASVHDAVGNDPDDVTTELKRRLGL